MKESRKATLDRIPATTGRDGAIDFAAHEHAINPSQRVLLEEGADYIAPEGEPIKLTEDGFNHLVAAHMAGHDVVIAINGRDAFVFPAGKS
jgi:hypothetical protein